jgi:hypothetical protein
MKILIRTSYNENKGIIKIYFNKKEMILKSKLVFKSINEVFLK